MRLFDSRPGEGAETQHVEKRARGGLMTWNLKEPECLTQARLMVAAPEFVYEQLKFYSENVGSWDGKEELEKLRLKRNDKLIDLALAQCSPPTVRS
jgi:hypothetical protein